MAIYVRRSNDAYFWFLDHGTVDDLRLAYHHPDQLHVPTPPVPADWRKRDGSLKKSFLRAWQRYQRDYRANWIAELLNIGWVASVDVRGAPRPTSRWTPSLQAMTTATPATATTATSPS
jgi:hypothetical protein